MNEIPELEIDLLLLLYTFSDQYGDVDIIRAKTWAWDKLGVHIPNNSFTINQEHIDLLMDVGVVPDIRSILKKASGNS